MYHAFLSPAVQFLFKLSFASGFKSLFFNYTWYFFLWQWEIFLFSRKFVFQQFTCHASCLSKLRRQISCLHRNLTDQQDEVDARSWTKQSCKATTHGTRGFANGCPVNCSTFYQFSEFFQKKCWQINIHMIVYRSRLQKLTNIKGYSSMVEQRSPKP